MKTIYLPVALLASLVAVADYARGQVAAQNPDAAAAATVAAAEATKAKAQGDANLANSQSMISSQEAYARYLQNSQTSLDAYFRNKQVNQEATRPVRLTYEQYVAMAKKYGPDGLNEDQYDRASGRLNWPAVLNGQEFAEEREALNKLFKTRTPLDVGPGTEFYGHVHRIADSLNAKLKTKFTDLTSGEYIFATKFISGLIREAHEPLMIGVVANRQPPTAQPLPTKPVPAVPQVVPNVPLNTPPQPGTPQPVVPQPVVPQPVAPQPVAPVAPVAPQPVAPQPVAPRP